MPGCFNLMVCIPGREEATTSSLMYICHVGTVILGEGWGEDIPALGAVVKENRLCERGTCSMKLGLACALSVFSDIAGLTGSAEEFPVRPLIFIGTVDKEDFVWEVECAIQNGWIGRGDWILGTEPANEQIQIAHKGRTWFKLTIRGITTHTGNPRKGTDAIAAMVEAVCHTRKVIGNCPVHEDLGMSTVTFGQITGGYHPYAVPGSYKVWVDMRLVPLTDTATAKNIIEEAVEVAGAEIVGVRGSYTATGNRSYVREGSGPRLLASLKSACDRITGKDTYIDPFNGYTDTAVVAGTLSNRNCMFYGPDSLELAHRPDECVPYGDVCRRGRVLTKLAR